VGSGGRSGERWSRLGGEVVMRPLQRSLVAGILLSAGLGTALALASCADILGIGNRELEQASPEGGGGPVVLDQKLNLPVRLVADQAGENLYWTEAGNTTTNGGVFTYNIQTGKIKPVAQGLPGPTDMAIDAQYLYWINENSGEIVKCETTSGCSSTTRLEMNTTAVGIAVDTTSLYWVDTTGSLYRANKSDGSNTTTLAGMSDGLSAPDACYVDSMTGDLLLSDPGTDGGANSVWRISTTGNGLTSLETSAGCPCRFTNSSSRDYWSSYDNDTIYGQSNNSGAHSASTVLEAQNGPRHVFYDPSSTSLYIANLGSGQKGMPDGTIVKSSLDGLTTANLAANLEQPLDLVVVGDYVYFLTWGTISSVTGGLINFAANSGTLVRVPK
jgi:DNA-binding beta-propeller fold protein YncE